MDELSIDDNGDGNYNKPIEINNLASVSIWAELSWSDLSACLPACNTFITHSLVAHAHVCMCVCVWYTWIDARTMYIVPCCSYCFVILALLLLLLYCVARPSQHERMGFRYISTFKKACATFNDIRSIDTLNNKTERARGEWRQIPNLLFSRTHLTSPLFDQLRSGDTNKYPKRTYNDQ